MNIKKNPQNTLAIPILRYHMIWKDILILRLLLLISEIKGKCKVSMKKEVLSVELGVVI